MVKKIIVGVLVIVAGYFVFGEVKDLAVDYYTDNHMVRTTVAPATEAPDQLCLTWAGDPATTQAIQWRTAATVEDGVVQYRLETAGEETATEVPAVQTDSVDRLVENDPENNRFTAKLEGLTPATAYAYRAGSKAKNLWSAWTPFTTAPTEATPFSFVYMGDVQVGFDYWETIVQKAHADFPSAAFYLIAGDLVNNGDYRDQWDFLFQSGRGVLDRRPLIPALGNHDWDKKDIPQRYLDAFALPENGPKNVHAEYAFSLRYGNALYIVLDSNFSIEEQASWLEEQLKATGATWKFVMFHHPAFASRRARDNYELRDAWTPIFDKYHVDVAFTGHDHAYLRTFPMKGGQKVATPAEGTYYIVSVAGNKYYDQEVWDYAEKQFAEVSTYQVIDIDTEPNRLTYKAYDEAGTVRDEFVIQK